jgi:hypothetical protein
MKHFINVNKTAGLYQSPTDICESSGVKRNEYITAYFVSKGKRTTINVCQLIKLPWKRGFKFLATKDERGCIDRIFCLYVYFFPVPVECKWGEGGGVTATEHSSFEFTGNVLVFGIRGWPTHLSCCIGKQSTAELARLTKLIWPAKQL